MTHLILTCGTSALPRMYAIAANDDAELESEGEKLLAEVDPDTLDFWARNGVQPDGWEGYESELGAEYETLTTLAQANDLKVDPLWLLASDTAAGRLAALTVATLMGRNGRVRSFVASPAGVRNPDSYNTVVQPRGPTAEILTIQNLTTAIPEVQGDHPFSLAARALGLALRSIMEHAKGDDLHVDMSGGYKATIPLMTLMLGALRRVYPGNIEVTIRHTAGPHLIHVPVPHLDVGRIRDRFSEARRGRPKLDGLYADLLFEQAPDGIVRPTAAAHGLAALLDEPAP